MVKGILRAFVDTWRARSGFQRPRAEAARTPWETSHRLRGLLGTASPFTLSDPLRLSLLYGLAREALDRTPGDFVECGVFNGGSAAVLAGALLGQVERRLWLYDTFAGLPEPGWRDGPEAQKLSGALIGSVDNVAQLLDQVGFPRTLAVFRKGPFQETFREALPERVALLHVDADWYDGVLLSLRALYPRIPPGGIIVLDDFGHWEGARRAFYEFCNEQALAPLLERVGYTQAFWRKGQEHTRDMLDRYPRGIYRPACQ
jgi:O-methyltransferase